MSLDFRPDDANKPGVLVSAQFLLPDKAGNYRTAYSASQIQASVFDGLSAMTSAALGARMVQYADATPAIYVGNTTQLWEVTGQSGGLQLNNVTRALGAYATGSNRWWFCPFGDTIVASNYADATQARSSSAAGTLFSALSGAPKAKFFLSQSGFLLAFNYDDGTAVPNGVKWATQGSSTTWTPATGNTAGAASLKQSPGAIVAGAEIHDIVAVWKRNSMYVGRVVGGAGTDIWRFDLVSPKIGCVSQEAWASTPVGIIFVSGNGIYRFDGSVPVPIDRGIRNEIYRNFGTALSSVQMSHDEASQCVYIWVTGGLCYAYNYASDKWGMPYLSGSLGNANYTSMSCIVRDANYPDLVTILSGTGSPGNYSRAHLVISSEKKICNLENKNAGTGINANYGFLNVRDPKAGPDDLTQLVRAVPIHIYNPESGSYDSEPTSGTMTVGSKPRIGKLATTSQPFSMDATNVRYDCNVVANTLSVTFQHTAQTMLLADIMFDTKIAGVA